MSLDVWLETEPCPCCGRSDEGWERNITHNLTAMASAAGIYEALWHPERLAAERSYPRGYNVLPLLRDGLEWLLSNPEKAKEKNPPNGWGDYDGLVAFVMAYIKALEDNEDAVIKVSR